MRIFSVEAAVTVAVYFYFLFSVEISFFSRKKRVFDFFTVRSVFISPTLNPSALTQSYLPRCKSISVPGHRLLLIPVPEI